MLLLLVLADTAHVVFVCPEGHSNVDLESKKCRDCKVDLQDQVYVEKINAALENQMTERSPNDIMKEIESQNKALKVRNEATTQERLERALAEWQNGYREIDENFRTMFQEEEGIKIGKPKGDDPPTDFVKWMVDLTDGNLHTCRRTAAENFYWDVKDLVGQENLTETGHTDLKDHGLTKFYNVVSEAMEERIRNPLPEKEWKSGYDSPKVKAETAEPAWTTKALRRKSTKGQSPREQSTSPKDPVRAFKLKSSARSGGSAPTEGQSPSKSTASPTPAASQKLLKKRREKPTVAKETRKPAIDYTKAEITQMQAANDMAGLKALADELEIQNQKTNIFIWKQVWAAIKAKNPLAKRERRRLINRFIRESIRCESS